MATVEEPILVRINRLDNILRQLEEIRGGNKSAKSSSASSGTLTSDGRGSSIDFSPKSLEKQCRPIDDVIVETENKGSLIERLVQVEDRVLKLSLHLEEELVAEKMRVEKSASSSKEKAHKKGIKQLVKSCVGGRKKHKARTE